MAAKATGNKGKADTASSPNDGTQDQGNANQGNADQSNVDQAAIDAQAAADAEAKAKAEALALALGQAQAAEDAAAQEQARAAEEQARAAAQAEAQAAAEAAALLATKSFPRDMLLVNETAQQWVVRKHVQPHESVVIHVSDADDLKSLRSNCFALLSISDYYRPVEPAEGEEAASHALRVVEIEDDQT